MRCVLRVYDKKKSDNINTATPRSLNPEVKNRQYVNHESSHLVISFYIHFVISVVRVCKVIVTRCGGNLVSMHSTPPNAAHRVCLIQTRGVRCRRHACPQITEWIRCRSDNMVRVAYVARSYSPFLRCLLKRLDSHVER